MASSSIISSVAALRCLVGAALIAKPAMATSGDAGRTALVRTIGVRDLVLGAGTLAALRGAPQRALLWTRAGLLSDVGDTLVAVASRRELGTPGTLVAAGAPLPFVAAVCSTRPWRRVPAP